MRKRWITRRAWAGAILALALVWIPACGERREPAPKAVRVAFIASMRGDLAGINQSTWDAANLAVREVNAKGGALTRSGRRPVDLVLIDPGQGLEGALTALRQAVSTEQAVAVVGGFFSREAIPMARVAEELRVPFITPGSTNPETTRGMRYTWRMPFTDAFQGRVMARFARTDLGSDRAAVLYDAANDYCRGLAENFKTAYEELGGRVTAFESYLSGEQDWSRQMRRMAEARPDLLVLPNLHSEAPGQVRQARAAGIRAQVLGGDGWGMLAPGPDLAVLEGAFLTSTWDPRMDTAASRRFVAAFAEAYGREPGSPACLAFDAMGLLFAALDRVRDVSPEALRQALADVGELEGAGGVYRYRGGGDPDKSVAILRVKSGGLQLYRELPPAR